MKNYIDNFLNFEDKSTDPKIKLKNLFYSIFYSYFIIFLFLFATVFFYFLINYFLHTNYDLINVYSLTKYDQNSPMFIVVLFGPIVEEILFRLWLKLNKYEFTLSVLFWLFFLINGTFIEFRISLIEGGVFILLSLFSLWGINYFFNKNSINWMNYEHYFYVISLILFSTLHLFNLDTSGEYFWSILPVYIFSKFIIGFYITKLRINYGFFWGLAFHIIINGVSFAF
jgi:hypothetical protein